VTTVAEVLADLMPTARVSSAGEDALARPVAWVRVLRARVPALEALEPGDLVIVPSGALDVVAPRVDEADQLVDALVRGAASAIVVVGAAGEPRNRARLPGLPFPEDAQRDPDEAPQVPGPPRRVILTGTSTDLGGLEALYTELDRGRHRRGRSHMRSWLVLAVVTVVALAGVVAVTTWWLRSQWYVGAQSGTVTVFTGIPGTVLGVDLHAVHADTGIAVSALPTYDQDQVSKTIHASSQADAERVVRELQARALACTVTPSTAGCPAPPPGASATPRASPSPSAGSGL